MDTHFNMYFHPLSLVSYVQYMKSNRISYPECQNTHKQQQHCVILLVYVITAALGVSGQEVDLYLLQQ